MLNYRKDVVLKGTGANALWGASYLVTAYPVGAEASAGSAGTTITVRAGHSFRAGDKFLLAPGSQNVFSGTDSVQSVTATSIVMGSSYSVASGDLLVNLGPDTGTAAPNFTSSPMVIYSDPAGGSSISNATVTCDSQGEFEYYHKGDGRFWELIRSSATAVVEANTGFGGVAGRLNVQDYGAVGDGSTNDTSRIASTALAVPTTGGELYFPATSSFYSITGGPTFSSYTKLSVRGDKSEIRVAASTADTVYSSWPNYGLDSLLRFVDCDDLTVEGLTLNGNISNRTANVGSESFNCCIFVAGSDRVTIRNCFITEAMTDGIDIEPNSGATLCTSVVIDSCSITKSRRNNISPLGQDGLSILNCLIDSAGTVQGTNPKAGIDIEPYTSSGRSKNVTIRGNTISNSAGTNAINVAGTATVGLVIADNILVANATTGINIQSSTSRNTKVVVSGNSITGAGAAGSSGIRVVENNCDVISNNIITGFDYGIYGPLELESCEITGNKVYANNSYGIVFVDYISANVIGNFLEDNSQGQASSATVGWGFYATALNSSSVLNFSCNICYGTASVVNVPSGAKLTAATGNNIAVGNSFYNITSPSTPLVNFSKKYSNYSFGASTPNWNLTGNMNFNVSGEYLYIGDKKHTFGTAAPTSGSYNDGDWVYNTNNTQGVPVSWVCVTSGTPGTWVPVYPIPNLGANQGDASPTLTVGSSNLVQRFTTTLTANRTVTLSTTGAFDGAWFRIVRKAATPGTFTLDVGGLKTIPVDTNAFVDVMYDGASWVLTGYGVL